MPGQKQHHSTFRNRAPSFPESSPDLQSGKTRPQIVMAGTIIFCVFTLLFPSGCSKVPTQDEHESRIKELEEHIQDLQKEISIKNDRLKQLNGQLDTLRGFPADRLEQLVTVELIEFGRYTRIQTGKPDAPENELIIYLLLRDRHGDRIKAAGTLLVELWDLDAPEGKNLIIRKNYSMAELTQYYLGGVLADHYKIQIPCPKTPNPNLTLKCRYTETLTGKTFEIQQLIELAK
ncbi:MAG: hypothetical protein JW860_13530 [Sedimentisphaerales bacterium]|nr:hypothetical protein [Sedimentisphaerales bacterium]